MAVWGPKEMMQAYSQLLRSQLRLTFGCTEPGAVALACAKAASLLPSPVQTVHIQVCNSIGQNGQNAVKPGTGGQKGLAMAAALGALTALPERELCVLKCCTPEQIHRARAMVEKGSVKVSVAETKEAVFVEATCGSAEGSVATACIRGTHTHFIHIELDGEIIFHDDSPTEPEEEWAQLLNIEKIYRYSLHVPVEQLFFLFDVVRVNLDIAQEGLLKRYGLGIGKAVRQNGGPEPVCEAVSVTAAAADAWTAGCEMSVFGITGSGNQGLTSSLPVISLARSLNYGDEAMLRALALSGLVTIYAESCIGHTSCLCGCSLASAIGCCTGIISLLGGGLEQIYIGLQLMTGSLSVLNCNGVRPGCAIKVAAAVDSACRTAFIAAGINQPCSLSSNEAEQLLRSLGKQVVREA